MGRYGSNLDLIFRWPRRARVRSKSAHFTKIEMYDWIVDYDDPCSGFDPLTRDLNQAE